MFPDVTIGVMIGSPRDATSWYAQDKGLTSSAR